MQRRDPRNVHPTKPDEKALRWCQERFGPEKGIDRYIKYFSLDDYLEIIPKAKRAAEERRLKGLYPEPEPEPKTVPEPKGKPAKGKKPKEV